MTRLGRFQRADKFLNRMGADNLRALCLIGQKVIDLRNSPIEDGDFKAVVVHIQDQVLAHDGQPDQTDITSCVLHSSKSRNIDDIVTGVQDFGEPPAW